MCSPPAASSIATAYYDQILKNKDALSDSSKEIDILDLIF